MQVGAILISVECIVADILTFSHNCHCVKQIYNASTHCLTMLVLNSSASLMEDRTHYTRESMGEKRSGDIIITV